MLFILFYFIFWLQYVKQEFILFFSIYFFKKSDVLYFFLQAQINSPTETAVDSVLDVLENSHGNVCSEVLIKVAVCQQEVC